MVLKRWTLMTDEPWLQKNANLKPLEERESFKIIYDVYDYKDRPVNTLRVDYASKYIGGGALGNGFVQEEQMFAQSADLMLQLYDRKIRHKGDVINELQALTIEWGIL